MGDLTKILDGNVGEVKTALEGKSNVDLLELRKQEEAGKNRSGVLTAIDAALTPAGGTPASDAPTSDAPTSDAPTSDAPVDVALADTTEPNTSTAGDLLVGGDVAAARSASNDVADAGTAPDDLADNGIAPAETIDTSGAPQQIVPDVDMKHPAVDADPRAHTTAVQNRIDFNDPSLGD